MNALARYTLHRAPARGRDMPHVPDNLERLRTYRQLAEPRLGNGYPWPHLRRDFADFADITDLRALARAVRCN